MQIDWGSRPDWVCLHFQKVGAEHHTPLATNHIQRRKRMMAESLANHSKPSRARQTAINNPDIVNTIVESCIVWGMSACLHDAITIKDGSVQQSNFHDFSVSRMDQAPVMEIHQVDSDRDPVGAGECAVGPVAPAIANAVFQATGKRLRSLPLKV